MISRSETRLAFRNRAIALVVCTTGAADLAASAVGYTRLAGSFITDGFQVGQEATPTGFTQTDPGVITKVEAQLLSIEGGRTVQTSGVGRSLTVGLPAQRAWNNLRFVAEKGRPYVEDTFLPGAGSRMVTMPNDGGLREDRGLWILRYYGLTGLASIGIDNVVDKILALFAPGTALTAGSETIRIREDVAPFADDIVPQEKGWSVVSITVHWYAHTRNAVTA